MMIIAQEREYNWLRIVHNPDIEQIPYQTHLVGEKDILHLVRTAFAGIVVHVEFHTIFE